MIVILPKAVEKQIERIERGNPSAAFRIKTFIEELEFQSSPTRLPNATKLVDTPHGYRWRIGDYRVLGNVFEDELVIEIIKVATRADAYK